MSKIIDRAGKGAALTGNDYDSNISTAVGKNQPIIVTTHTITVSDQSEIIEYLNASPIAVTLPDIATVSGSNIHTDDFTVTLKNIGVGIVTITRGGTDTFDDGTTSKTLEQYGYITLQTDSTLAKWNILNQDSMDKLPLDGSKVMTGNLFIGDGANTASAIVRSDGTNNALYWMQDQSGVNRGACYYNLSDQSVRLRLYASDGTTIQSQITIDADGGVHSLGHFTVPGGFVPTTNNQLTPMDFVLSGSSTLTNKTLTSPVINGRVTGTAFGRGALVYTSSNLTISDSTQTDLAFNSETYDDDAIHDNSTNNARLTVPSGVTRVRLTGNVRWSGSGTNSLSNVTAGFYKNGSNADKGLSSENDIWDSTGTPSNAPSQSLSSSVLQVTSGDYFTLRVSQDTGSNQTVTSTLTWFSMEIIR